MRIVNEHLPQNLYKRTVYRVFDLGHGNII